MGCLHRPFVEAGEQVGPARAHFERMGVTAGLRCRSGDEPDPRPEFEESVSGHRLLYQFDPVGIALRGVGEFRLVSRIVWQPPA
jgi:hypothetical protein